MVSFYRAAVDRTKGELDRARQAEQVANNERNAAIKESDAMMKKAMIWKQSLERYKRQNETMKEQK